MIHNTCARAPGCFHCAHEPVQLWAKAERLVCPMWASPPDVKAAKAFVVAVRDELIGKDEEVFMSGYEKELEKVENRIKELEDAFLDAFKAVEMGINFHLSDRRRAELIALRGKINFSRGVWE